ncbi:hypothetical protein Runsl_4453 [Runella slithyformis DSM 19594]|uniref:Uncharacterized protein n=1 Tax=Runella slithyformis (strain ATCC 29530 / DSM 19594 / LMG 11500 / NCIMB 11436 / LSU 4) TaxID=761193 RepID=A0A7U4E7L4_RUNSL|nr:hypothetical protein Runsl_4453 [Runella slithyformis DSM 19594]
MDAKDELRMSERTAAAVPNGYELRKMAGLPKQELKTNN